MRVIKAYRDIIPYLLDLRKVVARVPPFVDAFVSKQLHQLMRKDDGSRLVTIVEKGNTNITHITKSYPKLFPG